MDNEEGFPMDDEGLSFDLDQYIGGSLGRSPLGVSLGQTPDDMRINGFDELIPFDPIESSPPLPPPPMGVPNNILGRSELDEDDGEIEDSSSICVHCGKLDCVCPKERCRLCLTEIHNPGDMLTLQCDHKFHRKCFIDQGSRQLVGSYPPKCPACIRRNSGSLGSSIHEYDTYDFLGNFHRTASTMKMTKKMRNRFVCRTVKCGNEIFFENIKEESKIWRCGECQAQYCLKCKREGHVGSCDSYEWYLRTNQLTKFTVYQLFQQRKLKRCPRCQIYTHRYNTSPKVTCEKCSLAWCWYCIRRRDNCQCHTKKSPSPPHAPGQIRRPPPHPSLLQSGQPRSPPRGPSQNFTAHPNAFSPMRVPQPPSRSKSTPPSPKLIQQQPPTSGSSGANHFVTIPPNSVSSTKGKRGAQALLHRGRVYIIRSRNRHFKKENKWYDVYYCEENRKCGCKMSIKSLVGARPPVIYISRGEHTCNAIPSEIKPNIQPTPKKKKKKKKKQPELPQRPKQQQMNHPNIFNNNSNNSGMKVPPSLHQIQEQYPPSAARMMMQQQFPPNSFSSGSSRSLSGSPSSFSFNGASIPHYFNPPLCIDNRRRMPSQKINNPIPPPNNTNFNDRNSNNNLINIPNPQQQQQQQAQKPPLVMERVEPYIVPLNFPYARIVFDRQMIHPSIRISKVGETVTLSNLDRSVTEDHRIVTEETEGNKIEIMFKINSSQTRLSGWLHVAVMLRFSKGSGESFTAQFVHPRAFSFGGQDKEGGLGKVKKRKRNPKQDVNIMGDGDEDGEEPFTPFF